MNQINIEHLKSRIVNSRELFGREKRDIIRLMEMAESVKYGDWIEGDYMYFHCSECGFEFDEPENITPYCPNCGAKMDGGDEDEEA